jgi:hypothetical protein
MHNILMKYFYAKKYITLNQTYIKYEFINNDEN